MYRRLAQSVKALLSLARGHKRTIHLTFDDGPHPIATPHLLDTLSEMDVKATFFLVGTNINSPQGRVLAERISREGHAIGNHTYSHRNLTKLKPSAVADEIERTDDLIAGLAGVVNLLRPPYGALNNSVIHIAEERGYKIRLWNIDTADWKASHLNGSWIESSLGQIISRCECIVLNHENGASHLHIRRFINEIQSLPNTRVAGKLKNPSALPLD